MYRSFKAVVETDVDQHCRSSTLRMEADVGSTASSSTAVPNTTSTQGPGERVLPDAKAKPKPKPAPKAKTAVQKARTVSWQYDIKCLYLNL